MCNSLYGGVQCRANFGLIAIMASGHTLEKRGFLQNTRTQSVLIPISYGDIFYNFYIHFLRDQRMLQSLKVLLKPFSCPPFAFIRPVIYPLKGTLV